MTGVGNVNYELESGLLKKIINHNDHYKAVNMVAIVSPNKALKQTRERAA